MGNLSFDNSQFGRFFEDSFMNDLIKENSLIISDREKINIYKKNTLRKWLAEKFRLTITVKIGSETIVCNKASFFKHLHIQKDSDIDKIEKTFVAEIQNNRLIKQKIQIKIEEKISSLLPVWLQDLESQIHPHKARKISENQAQLGFEVVLEQDPVTKKSDVYVLISQMVGSGDYKKVQFPTHLGSMEQVAFATPHKAEESKQLVQEAKIHIELSECKHVVRGRLLQYQEGEQLVAALVLEYMNLGALTDLMKQRKLFENEQLVIALGAIRGLAELHERSYSHNDIKPDNILVRKNENGELEAKLGDLGFAEKLDPEAPRHAVIGLPVYESPEKRANKEIGDRFKDDVWAMGISLYEMRHGALPPQLRGSRSEINQVLKTNPESIRGKEPEKNSLDHIIWQMLEPDPAKRPTSTVVLQELVSLMREKAK
jgi:hypothetical protein